MAENRISRELANRELAERAKTWQPAQTLATPAPSNGYKFRWIRASMVGIADPTNISAKFREGWEPVRAEDHPELSFIADPNSRFKGNVEIGGLILCKAPEETMKQRDAYFNNLTRSQMAAVDNNFMRENDPRMPIDALGRPIARNTKVTFGGR